MPLRAVSTSRPPAVAVAAAKTTTATSRPRPWLTTTVFIDSRQQQHRCGFHLVGGPLAHDARRRGKRPLTELRFTSPSMVPPAFSLQDYQSWREWQVPSFFRPRTPRVVPTVCRPPRPFVPPVVDPMRPPLVLPLPPPPPPPPPPVDQYLWLNEDVRPPCLPPKPIEILDLRPRPPPVEMALAAEVEEVTQLLTQVPVDKDIWSRKLMRMCETLERAISLGEVSSEFAHRALLQLASSLHDLQHAHPTTLNFDQAWLHLCSCFINGATRCNIQGPKYFSSQFWNAILYRLSSVEDGSWVVAPFVQLLKGFADGSELRQLHGGFVSVLMKILRFQNPQMRPAFPDALEYVGHWCDLTAESMFRMKVDLFVPRGRSRNWHLHSAMVAQAATAIHSYTAQLLAPYFVDSPTVIDELAAGLNEVPRWMDADTIATITRTILAETNLADLEGRRLRFRWMMLLAKLTRVQTWHFNLIAGRLCRDHMTQANRSIYGLDSADIAELLIAQWTSRSLLDRPCLVRLKLAVAPTDEPPLATLCRVVNETQPSSKTRNRYADLLQLLLELQMRWALAAAIQPAKPVINMKKDKAKPARAAMATSHSTSASSSFSSPFWRRLLAPFNHLISCVHSPRLSAQLRASIMLALARRADCHLIRRLWHQRVLGLTMMDHVLARPDVVLSALGVRHYSNYARHAQDPHTHHHVNMRMRMGLWLGGSINKQHTKRKTARSLARERAGRYYYGGCTMSSGERALFDLTVIALAQAPLSDIRVALRHAHRCLRHVMDCNDGDVRYCPSPIILAALYRIATAGMMIALPRPVTLVQSSRCGHGSDKGNHNETIGSVNGLANMDTCEESRGMTKLEDTVAPQLPSVLSLSSSPSPPNEHVNTFSEANNSGSAAPLHCADDYREALSAAGWDPDFDPDHEKEWEWAWVRHPHPLHHHAHYSPGRPSRVIYVCRLVERFYGKEAAAPLTAAFLRARGDTLRRYDDAAARQKDEIEGFRT